MEKEVNFSSNRGNLNLFCVHRECNRIVQITSLVLTKDIPSLEPNEQNKIQKVQCNPSLFVTS